MSNVYLATPENEDIEEHAGMAVRDWPNEWRGDDEQEKATEAEDGE